MMYHNLAPSMVVGDIQLIERIPHLNGYTRWKSVCKCGNVSYPIESNIKRSLVKSCGNCGKNSYLELTDGLSVEVTSTNGYKFYIDKSDLNRVKKFKWSVSKDSKDVLTVLNAKAEQITTFLLGKCKGHEIDHIDRNRLNNRRSNLRICTHQQNRFNHNLQSNNTSGISGVRFNKARQKYVAKIKYCGLDIHLGYYKDLLSAMQARNVGADFLFGEFAVLTDAPEAPDTIKNYVFGQCIKSKQRLGKIGCNEMAV